MAEPKLYKGRPIKPNVTIRTEIIEGVEMEILEMPSGMKDPYLDGEKKVTKKRTTKPNEQKEEILKDLLNTLRSFSVSGNVYRKKDGKYVIEVEGEKYFSLALTANKSRPSDLTLYESKESE